MNKRRAEVKLMQCLNQEIKIKRIKGFLTIYCYQQTRQTIRLFVLCNQPYYHCSDCDEDRPAFDKRILIRVNYSA